MQTPKPTQLPHVPPAMARHLETARTALAAWRAEAWRRAEGGLPLREAIDFTLADAAARVPGQPHAAKALAGLAKAMAALAAAYSDRGGPQ